MSSNSVSRFVDRRACVWCLALAVFVAALLPQTARAHPDLDRGIARANEAEFESALTAFTRALESGSLTREELVVLLSERALVLHALGKGALLRKDLHALAMLAPDHVFDRRAPPELVSALKQTKAKRQAPLAFEARCDASSGSFHIEARVQGAEALEDARVRIHARGDGEVRFTTYNSGEADFTPETGHKISYYAELVGFGEVVLASAGFLENPRICGSNLENVSATSSPNETKAEGSNRKMWWWIGASGALAITAVAVVVIATRDDEPSSKTMVSRPMVTF